MIIPGAVLETNGIKTGFFSSGFEYEYYFYSDNDSATAYIRSKIWIWQNEDSVIIVGFLGGGLPISMFTRVLLLYRVTLGVHKYSGKIICRRVNRCFVAYMYNTV